MIPLLLIGSIAGVLIGVLIERNERPRWYIVVSQDQAWTYVRIVPEVKTERDEEIVGVRELEQNFELKFDRRLDIKEVQ